MQNNTHRGGAILSQKRRERNEVENSEDGTESLRRVPSTTRNQKVSGNKSENHCECQNGTLQEGRG